MNNNKFLRVELIDNSEELIALDQIARITKDIGTVDNSDGKLTRIQLKNGDNIIVLDSMRTLEARIDLLNNQQ